MVKGIIHDEASRKAALAAMEAELGHAEAELQKSKGQVKSLSAEKDRIKQHLEAC